MVQVFHLDASSMFLRWGFLDMSDQEEAPGQTHGMLERLTLSSSLEMPRCQGKGGLGFSAYTSAPAGWPLIKDRGIYILLYLHGNCIMSET